jgi:putative tryptophan/tyrosine transport system substrate-binding protein
VTTTVLRFAAVVLLAPLLLIPAVAQDGAKPRRLGVLMNGSLTDPVIRRDWQALVDGLRKHGWEEGRNVVLEGRFAGDDVARFHELAAELVALKVDVVMCANTQATEAARRKTTTIPIVMVNSTDPVSLGFVASLAQPGGNITGLTNQLETVAGKHFDLLREIKPGIERVAIIYGPDVPGSVIALKYQQEQMAPRLGLIVRPIPVSKPADLDDAFATIMRERPQALLVHLPSVVWVHRAQIAAFAIEQRLPTISGFSTLTRDGLLISYGYTPAANWRRAAAFVDRIFKGANPAELPVEQLQRFDLVVNLKAARELGLTIPSAILLRADEVIE